MFKLIMYLRLFALKIKVKIIKKQRYSCEGEKIIFLFGTPKHGNLGDHAIALAERKFFSEYFPDYTVIEITLRTYINNLSKLKNIINTNLICITGGGSCGTLWLDAEKEIQEIISVFKYNPIVVFPQTIYYEDSEWGRNELEKSRAVYGMNKNLYLCARERKSFDFMKKEYTGANVFLIPDMVTYLKPDNCNNTRKNILLCIRQDKESIMSDAMKNTLTEIAENYSGNATGNAPSNAVFTDTVVDARINPGEREKYVNEKLAEFMGAELVITDRLHGMIFSAITGTPCIALNNRSDKVKNVYEFISYLEYVHYIDTDDISEIESYIHKMKSTQHYTYDNSALSPYFNELHNIVSSALKSIKNQKL